MTYKNLRPAQVILDPQNPRLPDGTSSDREAINRLLDEGAEALINLARDMAKTGQTNPAELPIAIKHGSKYLVLEGNRRFAALKLLNDPALAKSDDHKAAFRRARALGTPPQSVFTLIANSREEADHWIVLRHTGENNGRGVKRWSTAQAATHARRANKSIDSGTLRSMAIADEVEAAYAGDAELVTLVRQARSEKLTNIGRLFSMDVLNRLHFSIQVDKESAHRERILLTRHTREDLRDFFVWAFSLILERSVDAFKNPEIRRNLLLTIPHLLPRDADASATPFRLAEGPSNTAPTAHERPVDGPDDEPAEMASEDQSDRRPSAGNMTVGQAGATANGPTTNGSGDASSLNSRRREARPEKYLLQGLRLPNHPDRIQKLLQECRRLEIEAFPSIACVMMRVIVELSVSSPPALALSRKKEGDPLKDKIVGMLKFLDPDIEHSRKRNKELEQAYIEVTGDSTGPNAPAGPGIQYLNGFVHNPAITPDPHLARRFSKAFRPLLIEIDNRL